MLAIEGLNLTSGSSNRVLLEIPGAADLSAFAGQSIPVLTYTSVGPNLPAFVPQFANIGLTDVRADVGVTTANTVTVKVTDAGVRGFLGDSAQSGGGDNTWSYHSSGVTNWGSANYSYDPVPNGVNDVAWFNDSALPSSSDCILDIPVIVNSMLFNGATGYSVSKTGPGAGETITLSAVGSTISAQSAIQVLGGNNSVAPDILLASNPTISIAAGASLTLSGSLGDVNPAQPSTLTIAGPGTLTLSGAASTYAGPTMLNGGTLALGSANALGTTTSANLIFAAGTVTDAGADVTVNHGFTIAGDATIAPVNNLTIAGPVAYTGGDLTMKGSGTVTFATPTATTNVFGGSLNVNAGTLAIGGTAGSTYAVGSFNVAYDVGLTGAATMAGDSALCRDYPVEIGLWQCGVEFHHERKLPSHGHRFGAAWHVRRCWRHDVANRCRRRAVHGRRRQRGLLLV